MCYLNKVRNEKGGEKYWYHNVTGDQFHNLKWFNKLERIQKMSSKNQKDGQVKVVDNKGNGCPPENEWTPRVPSKVQPFGSVIERMRALENGYLLYWNGRVCKNGHTSMRYSRDGICKKCYYANPKVKIDREKFPHEQKAAEIKKIEAIRKRRLANERRAKKAEIKTKKLAALLKAAKESEAKYQNM